MSHKVSSPAHLCTLRLVRGRREWDAGGGCGALLGTVVLSHQVFDAMLGQVEGQVTAAGPGGPADAAAVSPQRRAELHIRLRLRTGRGSPEFRVALEDLTLQAHCRGKQTET